MYEYNRLFRNVVYVIMKVVYNMTQVLTSYITYSRWYTASYMPCNHVI